MRCFSSFKLTGSGGTKTLSLIYPHKKKSQGVKSGLIHNVESVYFFYSNPVYMYARTHTHTHTHTQTRIHIHHTVSICTADMSQSISIPSGLFGPSYL